MDFEGVLSLVHQKPDDWSFLDRLSSLATVGCALDSKELYRHDCEVVNKLTMGF